MKYFTGVVDWIRNTVAFERSTRELNSLTDMELKDMGLSRCDVRALADKIKRAPQGT